MRIGHFHSNQCSFSTYGFPVYAREPSCWVELIQLGQTHNERIVDPVVNPPSSVYDVCVFCWPSDATWFIICNLKIVQSNKPYDRELDSLQSALFSACQSESTAWSNCWTYPVFVLPHFQPVELGLNSWVAARNRVARFQSATMQNQDQPRTRTRQDCLGRYVSWIRKP